MKRLLRLSPPLWLMWSSPMAYVWTLELIVTTVRKQRLYVGQKHANAPHRAPWHSVLQGVHLEEGHYKGRQQKSISRTTNYRNGSQALQKHVWCEYAYSSTTWASGTHGALALMLSLWFPDEEDTAGETGSLAGSTNAVGEYVCMDGSLTHESFRLRFPVKLTFVFSFHHIFPYSLYFITVLSTCLHCQITWPVTTSPNMLYHN